MPFYIVSDNITKMNVDAIVNAANTDLQMGGGVCGAIFTAAGITELQSACDAIGTIQTGEAVITNDFALKAKHIIHTAGPIYRGGNDGEADLLSACYTNCLQVALDAGCKSIAFPIISSGIYGYPKDEAIQVATGSIQKFMNTHHADIKVYLVVYDKSAFAINQELLSRIENYLDENYLSENIRKICSSPDFQSEDCVMLGFATTHSLRDLDKAINLLDVPFSTSLLRLINAKGMDEVEVYKRANMDRKLFSKIRSNKGYIPRKRTVIALAIALRLNVDEAESLLKCAGFALSDNQKMDVIIKYFIENKQYDIISINEVLFYHDQPLLGGQ